MRTLDNGQPLRDAIASAGLSIGQVAALTKDRDPRGKGIRKSTIGNLVSTGSSARDTCSTRTATLIALALQRDLNTLFAA